MSDEERLHREYEKLLRERIEELEAKLDLSEGALDVASKSWGECQRVLGQTEARLAKCQALMHAGLAEYKRRLVMALEALVVIDALDPEGLINGCSQSGLRGLVLRMGETARTVLAELEGEIDARPD
jgi:hypothetical protein